MARDYVKEQIQKRLDFLTLSETVDALTTRSNKLQAEIDAKQVEIDALIADKSIIDASIADIVTETTELTNFINK